MSPSDDTTVPGMAEAIEGRRRALHLTIGQFATAAGLTRQGLADVRAGRRKSYQDVTLIGVAKAFGWGVDWYDRLLAGEEPEMAGPAVDMRTPLERKVDELSEKVAWLTARLEQQDN